MMSTRKLKKMAQELRTDVVQMDVARTESGYGTIPAFAGSRRLRGRLGAWLRRCAAGVLRAASRGNESGQGTTEYAILVGVLVVIAILAITVFRDNLQSLWDAIASGINSL